MQRKSLFLIMQLLVGLYKSSPIHKVFENFQIFHFDVYSEPFLIWRYHFLKGHENQIRIKLLNITIYKEPMEEWRTLFNIYDGAFLRK